MKTIVASHNPDLARDFDRDLLRRRDLRLVTAHTTHDLIERLRAGADLCFLDRMLPDGDCHSALQAIRDEKKLSSIPVVMVTATGAPASDRAHAREAGFADVVELPAAPGALSLLVARLLGVPLREDERFSVRVHVFESGEHALDPPKDTSGAGDYLGTSIDLSENGMLLKARRDVAPGTRLDVRFGLPGRAGELAIKGRVVRIDAGSFAPAKGLALAFDELGATESAALREYLKVLVSGRPFYWQMSEEEGRQVVSLFGVLRADSDLEPLKGLRGEVWFRLREFRRISSDSVQRWIELIRSLSGVSKIHLLECPISFVHQANLITNLLERQEVESFYAPYACDACGLDEEKLLEVKAHLDGGKRRQPPEFPCSGCGAPLVFDDLVEQYFAFLDR
ncbi:MAG TPA: PilZ domain-containing protein [Polyangia bacterium]|nr:PilZ domain-containing protein [Polyangia bacterium]